MIVRRDIETSPFRLLQDQALALIQELCGNRWTNFNEHDPGVTILDALHYALLELQYTLQFPFESYLAAEGKIDFDGMGLFPGGELFRPDVLTPADYERLILKNIKAVTACRVTLSENHRYRIEAETTLAEEGAPKEIKQLIRGIEELYHSHRNLCEELEEIRLVKIYGKREFRELKEDLQYEPEFVKNRTFRAVPFPETHYSLQNHFPDCYGINSKGVPAGADAVTKMKILQLQGYLSIFDYLLAWSRHQVAGIRELFELSGEIPREPMPLVVLDAMDRLVDRERFNENKVTDLHYLHLQKSRYLDALDVLYGEDTRRFFPDEEDLQALNRKRATLIRYIPHLNAIRFRSFNLLKINEKNRDSAGIVQFMAAVNGSRMERETSLGNLFSRYNLQLIGDGDFFSEYKNLDMKFITSYIEHQLFDYEIERVPEMQIKYDDNQFHKLRSSIYLFWHNKIFESFLTEGLKPSNYRIAYWYETNGYLLIFHIPGKKEWLNLGLFSDRQTLVETANLLWQFLKTLRVQSQQIYLVEHVLLGQAEEEPDVLTVVVPNWIKTPFDHTRMEALIRERLPAHLEIRFMWLRSADTYDFEKKYFEWREALAARDPEWIKRSSDEIKNLTGN